MVSVAMSCVKYLIFFFNLIFAIIGIAILAIGGIIQGVYHNYSVFVNENYAFVPLVIIIGGAIIFIIAFFGCCGTIKENHCMISTFATLLLLIFLLEIAAAVAGYVFYNDVKGTVQTKMEESLAYYSKDPQIQKSWDIIQNDLQCCGVNGSKDWNGKIAPSCCPQLHQEETCTAANAHKQGCFETLENLIEKHALILIGFAGAVALIQLLGIGLACCLAHSIRRGYETV